MCPQNTLKCCIAALCICAALNLLSLLAMSKLDNVNLSSILSEKMQLTPTELSSPLHSEASLVSDKNIYDVTEASSASLCFEAFQASVENIVPVGYQANVGNDHPNIACNFGFLLRF